MSLKEFIVKAKFETYASNANSQKLEEGSKLLSFKEDKFSYIDKYYGFNPFLGEEIVFENNKLIWGMNYFGEISSKKVSSDNVYEFLRKAMKLVSKDRPFRGPASFKEKEFEYSDESIGKIDSFSGIERIFFNGKQVYKLEYHGGFIGEK
ncbi:MAG: DUF5680 domain-containing protein [archaeon]|nr:DUF5680 domain-containing protein [archaeon]